MSAVPGFFEVVSQSVVLSSVHSHFFCGATHLPATYVRTLRPQSTVIYVDHGSLAWRLQVKLWQCGVPVVPWFCPSLSELWNLKRFKSRLHLVKYLCDSAVGILCLQRTVQLVNVVDGGHLAIRTVNCELWDTQEVQNAVMLSWLTVEYH